MDFQDSLYLVSGQGAKTPLKAARERWPPAEIFPGGGGCWGPAGAGLPPFMLVPGDPPSARTAKSKAKGVLPQRILCCWQDAVSP